MKLSYYEDFSTDNGIYRVEFLKGGEVIFRLKNPRIDSFGHEIEPTSLENGNGNSIPIFRNVMKIIDRYVYRAKPPVLSLKIVDLKRHSLYDRLIRKFLNKHPEYVTCDSNWKSHVTIVRVA